VIVSPQGDRIFSVSDDKQLRIWDAKTCKETKAIPAHDGAVVGFSLSSDLAKAVTIGADKTAKLWNLTDGKLIATIALAGSPQSVTFSPNGLRIAIAFAHADRGNRICTYDTVSGKNYKPLPKGRPSFRSLYFLSDNRTLVATGDDKSLNVHDAAAAKRDASPSRRCDGIIYHSNGTQAFTAGKDKLVRYLDVATEKT